MRKLRVLVAVQPPLLSDQLKQQLKSDPSVEIVGYAQRPAETLLMAGVLCADVVLLRGEQDDSVPALCSHLFGEFPEMVAVAIAPSGDYAMVFQQTVTAVKVERLADIGLISVLGRDVEPAGGPDSAGHRPTA